MSHASEQLSMQMLLSLNANRVAGALRRALRVMSMSRLNYRLAFLTDIACAVSFGYLGLRTNSAWTLIGASAFLGAFTFSFVEYALHRWMFHASSLLAGEVHASHHRGPKDPSALPFWSSAVCAPALLWLLTRLFGTPLALWFLCGFFAAYFSYGMLHHLQHSVRIKNVPFKWLRRKWIAHAVHHGRADVNFGVTTSFWDRVFGTYQAPKR
jgi:sterol desaturase/sphingolipid hydroxylase (fatty acid hydroxylase superfamily)